MELLCEFDFEIKHVKGKENKVVDALSRKFHVVAISVRKYDLSTKFLDALVEDEHYLQIREGLQQKQLGKKYEGYQLEEDNLLAFKGRLYVPNCAELKKMVLDGIHQMSYPGHIRY